MRGHSHGCLGESEKENTLLFIFSHNSQNPRSIKEFVTSRVQLELSIFVQLIGRPNGPVFFIGLNLLNRSTHNWVVRMKPKNSPAWTQSLICIYLDCPLCLCVLAWIPGIFLLGLQKSTWSGWAYVVFSNWIQYFFQVFGVFRAFFCLHYRVVYIDLQVLTDLVYKHTVHEMLVCCISVLQAKGITI